MRGSACVGDGSIYWLINCYTFSLINANELLPHAMDGTGFFVVQLLFLSHLAFDQAFSVDLFRLV